MDDDAIKVLFRHNNHLLELNCGNVSFSRFKDLIRAEAKLSDTEFDRTGTIVIVDMGKKRPAPEPRIRNRIALWGCGLVLCLLLGVMGVGIQTIWRWLTVPQ